LDIKKKIFVDLFSAPSVLVPFFIGATSLIVGWAAGIGLAVFIGVAGVVGAGGSLLTRLIFGLDKIAKDAYDFQNSEKQKLEAEKLGKIEERLRGYPRAIQCLEDIRMLRQQFTHDLEGGKLSVGAYAATDKINAVLEACVRQLEALGTSLPTGDPLKEIMDAKDRSGKASLKRVKKATDHMTARFCPAVFATIEEVEETVAHTRKVIDEFRVYSHDKTKTNLTTLRNELDQALKVAKSVDQKLSTFDSKPVYKDSEFE
jgi:hypothetical protein